VTVAPRSARLSLGGLMVGIVGLVAIGLMFAAFWIFGRLEDNFAENI